MHNEESPKYADWKSQIASELGHLNAEVILVGHSVGGSVLIKYLAEERVEKPIAGLFLLAAQSWISDVGYAIMPQLLRKKVSRFSPSPAVSKEIHLHKQASILLFGAANLVHRGDNQMGVFMGSKRSKKKPTERWRLFEAEAAYAKSIFREAIGDMEASIAAAERALEN